MLYILPQAIDNAADRSPDKEAICCSGKSLTYGELALRSSSLARVLKEQDVKRGDRVGIFMNKSLEAVISLYGIMKAGAAYVPMDPFSPPARLSYVINDCGIHHLLSKTDKLDALQQILAAGTGLECILGLAEPDELPVRSISWETIFTSPPLAYPYEKLTEQDLSYILYTSGSTGNPKGIVHTHRSALSFALWGWEAYSISSEDRLSNHAPLHFDLSTFDLFSSAIAGATTVIVPEAITKFPASLSRLIADQRISIWYSVPFALIQLLQHGNLQLRDLCALRWIIFAGEVFPTKHLHQLMAVLPDVRFSNLYGPTETNVCTYYHVPPLLGDSDEAIPIGRPCENVEDLVIDGNDQPVASGEVGELLIRGGVVMRGYWGQPEKNERSFYRRKNISNFEDLFYRTGDLVQLLPDGNYRYRGRKDRQIKIRGYRVELDEVETALLSHPLVKEAAVYTVPDGQGSNLIEAAVIRAQRELSEAQILEHLNGLLPSYAVPLKVHLMADFPRTSTGKINRRELQEIVARNNLAAPE
jgi:amino acid adenylation domain-containing protein